MNCVQVRASLTLTLDGNKPHMLKLRDIPDLASQSISHIFSEPILTREALIHLTGIFEQHSIGELSPNGNLVVQYYLEHHHEYNRFLIEPFFRHIYYLDYIGIYRIFLLFLLKIKYTYHTEGNVKLPFLLMQMVQPWCNLSRNYRNNRHNRKFYPYFCHIIDTIDIIETIE